MHFVPCSHAGRISDSGNRICRLGGGRKWVTPDFCATCPHSLVSLQILPELLADATIPQTRQTTKPRIAKGQPQELTPENLPCNHRGAEVRQELCLLCGPEKGKQVAIYACDIYGECSLRSYKNGKSPQCCVACPTRLADMEPPPKSDTAVVIISHNYGRYLSDAIDSARRQNAAEVIVIDDASDDETAAVAAEVGAKYIRHEVRNVHESRKIGFYSTTARYVCFLDADDMLPDRYIHHAAQLLDANPQVGIVFSDCQRFGDSAGLLTLNPKNIEHANYIHAGSVVRGSALETSGSMRRMIPMPGITHDWNMWRDVVRAGWKTAKNPTAYLYRDHPGSMASAEAPTPYYHRARLADETVTIVIPLSGRDITPLWHWLMNQTWPRQQVRLLLVDTVADGTLGDRMAELLPYRDVRLMPLPIGRPGLADEDRLRASVRRDVQRAVAELYARLRAEVTTEYCLIVEDDIVPPLDAIEQLLHGMDEFTAAVAGAAWARLSRHYLAWATDQSGIAELSKGIERVGGTGFHCTLIRRSLWQAGPIDGSGDYDREFFRWCGVNGWHAKIHWGVLCEHAGLKANEPWRKPEYGCIVGVGTE